MMMMMMMMIIMMLIYQRRDTVIKTSIEPISTLYFLLHSSMLTAFVRNDKRAV